MAEFEKSVSKKYRPEPGGMEDKLRRAVKALGFNVQTVEEADAEHEANTRVNEARMRAKMLDRRKRMSDTQY